MISRRQLLLVAANGLAASRLALANGDIEPLRIGLEDLEPWSVVENGKRVGILTNLIDEVTFRTKIPFTPRFAPSPRLSLELESMSLDLAVLFRRPVPSTMALVGECFIQRVNVATLAGSAIYKQDDLAKMMIATSRGMQYDNFADEFGFHLISTANISSALNMLLHRRVDGLLASEAAIAWSLKQLNLSRDTLSHFHTVGTNQVAIWSRNGLSSEVPEIHTALEAALREMRLDGRMQRLIRS